MNKIIYYLNGFLDDEEKYFLPSKDLVSLLSTVELGNDVDVVDDELDMGILEICLGKPFFVSIFIDL